jgi:membrane protein implicated in regulation of membrane protease activity
MNESSTRRKAVTGIATVMFVTIALAIGGFYGIVNALSFISLVLALLGNYFVNKKVKAGFIVWIGANIGWILVNVVSGQPNYLQMTMFFLYSAFNVHGYLCWSRAAKAARTTERNDAHDEG